jgi:transposase
VGSRSHFVAVGAGRDQDGQDVREFGSFTCDLYAIADWLEACGVDTVAIESTGVYWISLYEVLENRGFEVILVDPRKLKRAPGRKTDVKDCQWLQELHTYGLLSGAFRPDDDVCRLRGLVRQRETLVKQSSIHIQHIQKALTQMNVKLREVVREVTGVTGMRIVRAILDGERDPAKLASLRDHRCKNDAATLAKALEGNWRGEHLFALRQSVQLLDYCAQLIADCDQEIEKVLASYDEIPGTTAAATAAPVYRRRHDAHFNLHSALIRMTGVDLTEIEGIQSLTALKIVSEIGTDMSKWPSAKHFASWLCLCPGNKITGGRRLSGRTTPSANRVATALRIAAQSLWRSKSALGAFLRRIAARHGMPKAITATAHRLARMIYSMLRYGTDYVMKSQQEYEQQHLIHRKMSLMRQARALGLAIVDLSDSQQLPTLSIQPSRA